MKEVKNGHPTLNYLLHAVILGGVLIAAVRYLNGEEVLAALRTYNVVFVPFLLLTSLSYFLFKAWRFVLLVRSVSDVPGGIVFKGYIAGQTAILVPGGVAARAGLMHQVGVPVARSTAPIIMSSVLDMVGFLTALTQIDVDAAAAGAAIFRLATVVFEAFVGTLVYYVAWRGEKEIAGAAARELPWTPR